MSRLRSMVLIFGAVLVMLSTGNALAKSDKQTAVQSKKAVESEKKTIIMTSPSSVKSTRKIESVRPTTKTAKDDPLKKRVDDFFKRIDVDKNGKVSHEEFMKPDENFFKNSDIDNSGFLTEKELYDAWKKKMKHSSKYKMMREQLKRKKMSQPKKDQS